MYTWLQFRPPSTTTTHLHHTSRHFKPWRPPICSLQLTMKKHTKHCKKKVTIVTIVTIDNERTHVHGPLTNSLAKSKPYFTLSYSLLPAPH
jgi:hypothetical protein